MPLSLDVKNAVYSYCKNHLADELWYEDQFDFIQDEKLRKRIIEEFRGIRFAYKLYEGIEADGENKIFEVRHQILSYATIYEAVIHYVLYNYYETTTVFESLQYHEALAKVSIPNKKLAVLNKELEHNGKTIVPFQYQRRKKDESQVRFDDKCRAAEKLGLINKFYKDGLEIDLPAEIIEIYGYRNAIHLVAEQRKGIEYELDLSKRAYRRMKPFIEQIKERLKEDKKGIYA